MKPGIMFRATAPLAFLLLALGAGRANAESVVWTSAVNVAVSGNTITKNTSPDGWGSLAGGAVSLQRIAAGTDGYAEMTAQEGNKYRMFGLSDADTDHSYDTIDFAMYLITDGSIRIYESGTLRASGPSFIASDILRIERTGAMILYSKNGSVFYTSALTSISELMFDTSIHDLGGTISNAQIGFGGPDVPEPHSWLLLASVTPLLRWRSRVRSLRSAGS